MQQAGSDRHVPALDGVRGLAILAVLLSHFVPALAQAFTTPWANQMIIYAGPGAWGVDLFFVLSGFLITAILLDTRDSPDYWTSFFGRRALRILPLYYLFLFVIYLTRPPRGLSWTFWLHLSNWRPDLGISSNVLTWHFWSLAIEEQFYFFWPMVVAWLPPRQLGRACLVIAAGSAVARGFADRSGVEIETLHRLTPLALDGLAVGAYLAWCIRHDRVRAERLAQFSLPGFMVICFTMWILSRWGIRFGTMMVVGRSLVALAGGSLVMMAVTGRTMVAGLLRWRPLTLMGKYCYGLYLLHPVVVVYGIGPLHGLVTRLPAATLPVVWVAALAAGVLLSLALAALSWRLIESPFLSFKRSFPYRPAQTVLPAWHPSIRQPLAVPARVLDQPAIATRSPRSR